jgi:hypothetical protein
LNWRRGRAAQDRLSRLLAEIVGEREPRSGFPRPTLIALPEGCAVVTSDVEVTIDVTVSPQVAEAMLRAMAGARPRAAGEYEPRHEGELQEGEA